MNVRSDNDNELLAKVATDVAVLNARFDQVLPHLATKADVKDGVNRALYWLVGTLVGGFISAAGVFLTIQHYVHEDIVTLHAQMRGDRDMLTAQMRADHEALLAQMRADRDEVRQDIRDLAKRVDRLSDDRSLDAGPLATRAQRRR